MAQTIERKGQQKPQGQQKSKDKSVHPAIVAVVVGLVAFTGFIGYRSLMPKAPNPVQMTPQAAWLKEKAIESGGDINKLSPEDRKKLEQEQGVHAAEALKIMSNPNFR